MTEIPDTAHEKSQNNSDIQINQEYQQQEDPDFPLEIMEDLDEKTVDFIRPWFRKWRSQSMYQVLLLYRSTQERRLVYFCQQVHLYNQNDRSIMESLNVEVTLNEIDVAAEYKELIPKEKVSVHKIPFRLSDLTFFDTSHLCDSFNGDREKNTIDEDEEEEEEWDAPLKLFLQKETNQNISELNENNETANADKACQTDSVEEPEQILADEGDINDEITIEHTTKSDNNNSSNPNAEEPLIIPDPLEKDFPGVNANEVELENEELSNRINHVNDIRKPPKYMGITSKRGTSTREKTFDMNNVQPSVNNKTDEIPKYKSPIREMEEKFKTKHKSSDDDDPPYNFRSMLRKTNYSETVLKKKSEPIINTYDFTLKKLKKVEDKKIESVITSTELAPGLVIEGVIADL